MKTFKSQHIGISIECSVEKVYTFVSNPENLPQWAAGLSGSIKKVKGEWIAESPMGSVKVAFVPKNELGVLDHDVTLPSGEVVHNPMRVMPNGQGSEVVFTLFQRAGMTDEMFEKDAQAVRNDLNKLKDLLETLSR